MAVHLDGGCACGRVRYRLASAPLFVHCCHRRSCQRETGSAFVLNALIETDRIELTASAPVAIAVPTDSGGPHRIFRCEACQVAVGASTVLRSCASCDLGTLTRRTR